MQVSKRNQPEKVDREGELTERESLRRKVVMIEHASTDCRGIDYETNVEAERSRRRSKKSRYSRRKVKVEIRGMSSRTRECDRPNH